MQWFGCIAIALRLQCNGLVALRSRWDCIAMVWSHCDCIAMVWSQCDRQAIALQWFGFIAIALPLVAVRSLCDQWIIHTSRKYVMACDQTIASVFRRVHNWEL
jgi:hypothetical protein